MDKKIIVGVIALLILIGLMFLGRGQQTNVKQSSSETTNSLVSTEDIYDFGTISMKDGLVNHEFTITNPSDQDIMVKKISTSCMCTEAYIDGREGKKGPFGMEGMGHLPPVNEFIKAGESIILSVVYDPNAHGPAGVGTIDRLVFITDESGGMLPIEIIAIVTP